MCPFCISAAWLIAGGATSTSGLAAAAMRKLRRRNVAGNHLASTLTRQFGKANVRLEIGSNSQQRKG